MREACSLIWAALVRLFRSRASLVAEILVLRHQINIQRRHLPKRQTFSAMDRLIFAGLYRLCARSGSSEVKAALSDVSDRLHRYADVHRTLQMPEYQTRVNAALYLQKICLSISRSRLEPNNIKLILAVRPLSMPSDRCWRLGMIVYELITN